MFKRCAINFNEAYFLTMLILLLLLPMLMIHIVYSDRADPVLCIRSMFLFCPVQLFWMTRHKLIQNVYRKATHTPFYLIQLCLFPGSQFFPWDIFMQDRYSRYVHWCFIQFWLKSSTFWLLSKPPYCNYICNEFEFNIYDTKRQTLFY